jgi:O-antigen ligase
VERTCLRRRVTCNKEISDYMIYLVLAFILLYFFLAIRRLDWAVMLMLAALPTYLIRFKVLGIPFTLLEAMILTSFAVWLITNRREFIANLRESKGIGLKARYKNKNRRYPFDIEIVLLLIISFMAVGVVGFSNSAMGIWKAYFFEPVLAFILVLHLPLNPSLVRRGGKTERGGVFLYKIMWPLAISALVISLLAIYQKFTGHFIYNELWAAEETRRVTSFFGYPNAVGLYLGPLVLVMAGWLIQKLEVGSKKLEIFIIGIVILLSLLAIYFAKSEGALIAVIAGLIVFGLLAGKKARWAAIALVVVAGSAIMAYQPVRDYAFDKFTLNDLSGQIRRQQWRETGEMLKNGKIIAGAGLANYQKAILPYHQEGIFFNKDNDPEFHRHVVWNEEYKKSHWQPVEIYMYPHSILLNFWTELGLAGMLLFIWIIGKYFYCAVATSLDLSLQRGNRYLVLGLIGAMVVIIVHGMVDVPYFKNDLAVMFWTFIALISFINIEVKGRSLKNG